MTDSTDPTLQAPEPSKRARIGFVLLVLLLFGVPALIALALGQAAVPPRATSGEQPGGSFQGLVTAEEGGEALAGVTVELLALSGHDPSGAPPVVLGEEPLAKTKTGEDGTFTVVAPPHSGRYLIGVGGGLWQRSGKEVSFLDRKGEVIETPVIEFALRPACILEVAIVPAEGELLPRGGQWSLTGATDQRFVLGLVPGQVRREGEFEGSSFLVDGIPPMKGTLQLEFDSGQRVTLELELNEGHKPLRVAL